MSSSGSAPTHPVVKGIGFIAGGTFIGVIGNAVITLFTGVPAVAGTIILASGILGGVLGGVKELFGYFMGPS